MISSIEAHQKGLDAGMSIALDQLNEALGMKCANLGIAIAEVTFLKRKLNRIETDIKESRTDWK